MHEIFRIRLAASCVAVAATILCLRLISSAYTSGDDGYTYMAAMAAQGWVAATWEMVVFQGRFYQLFVYPLAMLPFQFDDVLTVNFFKVFTFLVFFSGAQYLFRYLLTLRESVICGALFLLLYETVGGSYNAFHGLPMWFGATCGVLLFSLGFHQKYLNSKDVRYQKYAILFYAIALLGYEIILLFAPLYAILTLLHLAQSKSGWEFYTKKDILIAFRHLIPFGVISFAYLVIYFSFRLYYPGTYVGAQGLSMGTLADTWKPIWVFSINSINVFEPVVGNTDFSLTSLIFTLVCLTALMTLFNFNSHTSSKNRSFIYCILVLATLATYIFLPNLLFGLTQRYRSWAAHGVTLYLGSVYSSIAIILLLYCTLKFVFSKIRNSTSHGIALFVFSGFLLLVGYNNSKNSENFFKQSNSMSVRWDAADKVINAINAVPFQGTEYVLCSNGFLYNDELPEYFRNVDMIADALVYWQRYFSSKSSREVRIVDSKLFSLARSSDQCDLTVEMSYRANLLNVSSLSGVETFRLSEIKSIPNFVDPADKLLRSIL